MKATGDEFHETYPIPLDVLVVWCDGKHDGLGSILTWFNPLPNLYTELQKNHFKYPRTRIIRCIFFHFGSLWFYGVMVSTQDSESCDPSSNLGRT